MTTAYTTNVYVSIYFNSFKSDRICYVKVSTAQKVICLPYSKLGKYKFLPTKLILDMASMIRHLDNTAWFSQRAVLAVLSSQTVVWMNLTDLQVGRETTAMATNKQEQL